MIPSNPDLPKLTRNEKTVLKKIIDEAKIPDAEIARKMGLSQQAIFKIRHKLEQAGVITGYAPIINFKKIGIETLVVLGIKFTHKIWDRYSEEQIAEKIRGIPQVITSYRIPDSRVSHLLVLGFKNIEQKDRFLMKMQTKYSKDIEIVHIYPFSVNGIIKNSDISLLNSIIDMKEFLSNEFTLD